MPLKFQKGFSVILVVIFIVILAALVLGGIYYFSEIYLPAQYAKEAVPIVEEVGKQVFQDSSNINQKDYKIALETIVRRQAVFSEARNQLDKFNPTPRKMKQFNEDVRWGLEYFLAANTEAQKRAAFLADLLEIYLIFKPEKPPFEVKTAKVSEYQKYYEDQIPRAKSLGSQIFGREAVSLEGVTFSQLKNSWQGVNLDLILENTLAQDPNQPFSGYTAVPPTSLQQQAMDNLVSFGRLADEAFSKNTTSDILSYRHYTGASKEDFDQRSQRIEAALEDLKKRYSINIP